MNRNYAYGCKPPTENADLVRVAIHKGFRYRNKLVELHRKHPNPWKSWNLAYKAECDLAYERIAKERRPPRNATPDDMRMRKAAISAAMKIEREAIKARMPAPEESPELRAERHAELGVDTRTARAVCGVYWGTYLLAEAAAEKAERFSRWTGDGAIGVQIQGGISPDGLSACTQVQLLPGISAKWSRLRIRIGTVPGKITPIWAEFPIRMHRPIPKGTRIQEVRVRREMRGDSQHWTAVFSLVGPVEAFREEPAQRLGICDGLPMESSVVGVDLGWRRIAPGLVRVAYWYGSDGSEGDVRMPSNTLDLLERYESARDKNLNAHQPALVEWLTGLGLEGVALWQSADRFAKALLDRDPPDHLRAWRTQDRHLANAIAGMERQIYNRRAAKYGEIAAMLAKRYGRVQAEECNLSDLRREKPGEGEDATPSRRLAALVAPGKFRMALDHAAERHGAEYVLVPCPDTTRTCAYCGHVNSWPDQSPLMLTCSGCDRMWDQDRNAARIIASASAVPKERESKIGVLSARQQRFRKNRSQQETEVVETYTEL